MFLRATGSNNADLSGSNSVSGNPKNIFFPISNPVNLPRKRSPGFIPGLDFSILSTLSSGLLRTGETPSPLRLNRSVKISVSHKVIILPVQSDHIDYLNMSFKK
jgi:hypothetical protein